MSDERDTQDKISGTITYEPYEFVSLIGGEGWVQVTTYAFQCPIWVLVR